MHASIGQQQWFKLHGRLYKCEDVFHHLVAFDGSTGKTFRKVSRSVSCSMNRFVGNLKTVAERRQQKVRADGDMQGDDETRVQLETSELNM